MTDAASHLAAVRQHYPDAHTTVESVERHLDLFQRCLGLRPADVLLADSICADDVNSIEYPKRAYEMPGPFKLGGLDGFPFVGLTGMAAFAGHVPDGGAVFIYHAPHIGVSKDGKVGEILCVGQSAPSGCCGACRAALAKLQAGHIRPGCESLNFRVSTNKAQFGSAVASSWIYSRRAARTWKNYASRTKALLTNRAIELAPAAQR